MSGKQRVYEVARDLGIENKALVALLQSVGATDVRNHMSAVGPDQVERVKRHLEKQSGEKPQVEERIRSGVVKRRGVVRKMENGSSPVSSAEPPERSAPTAAAAPSAPVHVAPAAARAPAEPAASSVARAATPVAPEPAAAPSAPAAPKPEPVAAAPEPAAPAPEPVVAKPEPVVVAPVPASAPAPEAPVAAPSAPVAPAPSAEVSRPAPPPAAATPSTPPAPESIRPSTPPRTGIDVWEGRPGVPMPSAPRSAPRRVQYDNKPGTSGGPVRRGPVVTGGRMGGGPGAPGGPRGQRRGIGSLAPRRIGSGPPVTQQRTARKMKIKIDGSISLQKLAAEIQAKAADLLMKLLGLGMTGININTNLDADTAKIVASEFGWEIEDVALTDEQVLEAAQGGEPVENDEDAEPRAPVVTVMGHVDHGKTTLLDYLRKASVASGEAGGITQHIGAYSVATPHGRITFLDTPGHAAFTAMRARGAKVTDLVVLVVAANDGVMPQTKEAVNHAKAAGCPVVVAVNKIDLDTAQPERVRRELSELGLQPEEWGGTTLFCEVSAITGQGIDQLLENIILQAEVLDLRAVANRPMSGVVVEAKLDKGRGPFATVLVTDGTLVPGDIVLAGTSYGRVRAMLDDAGNPVKSAGPADPVAIIGLSDVPRAGDPVHAIKSLKVAQELSEERRKRERGASSLGQRAMSLEEIAKRMSEAEQLELKVVIKSDVQGSVEAISQSLSDLSTEKVKVTVVMASVGAITESDVNLALAAKALILGFNVKPAGKAGLLAQREGVEIRNYRVIYDVIDDVRAAMEGMLAPTLVENYIGKAEVRKVFKVSKAGVVAGCMVVDGVVRRNAHVRVKRDKDVLYEGKLDSLKRFKDDAREVRDGMECGISFDGFNALEEGDFIEVFEMQEVRQTLE